jgi:N6-L-threonylcarbamoyladenine synthase
MAEDGTPGAVRLPRPMLGSGNLDFSFSGLKTAVLTLARKQAGGGATESLPPSRKADLALEIQSAIVDVLTAKSLAALDAAGRSRLVVAGGVGANRALRSKLVESVAARGGEVYFPDLAFCTDNGAMIALVGALRLSGARVSNHAFAVRPRWDLQSLTPGTPARAA